MPRRRVFSGGRGYQRGSRRETSWFTIGPVQEGNAGTIAGLVQVLNAAALARRPFTIIRTHCFVSLRGDNIANEFQNAAIGFAVVSSQASAIGITAVPTPITDLGSDLFYLHQVMMGVTLFSTAAAFAIAPNVYQIDSKAMRKVNDDQDVVVTAEGTAGGGFVLDIMGRFLVKEG